MARYENINLYICIDFDINLKKVLLISQIFYFEKSLNDICEQNVFRSTLTFEKNVRCLFMFYISWKKKECIIQKLCFDHRQVLSIMSILILTNK